jgi:hypothetical protein
MTNQTKLTIDFQNNRLTFDGSEKVEIPLKVKAESTSDLEAILAPSDLDKLARIKTTVDVVITG